MAAAAAAFTKHKFEILIKTPNFFTIVSFIHTSKQNNPDVVSKFGFLLNELDELQTSATAFPEPGPRSESGSRGDEIELVREKSTAEISHPWPEWVDLMEMLTKKGYFSGNRDPFGNAERGGKDFNVSRTACLNFGRDRIELIRYLSRKHIQVIVGFGCPSTDRKVVNSGKRLRRYVKIDEGNVCSACSLRGTCERAFVKAREDECGRTVDVIRFLMTYGLDHMSGSVQNKLCQTETVKKSARKLLKEMVEFSQTEPDQSTTRENYSFGRDSSKAQGKGQTEVPMKQGDWNCPKCNFLNFARNIKCLRCNGVIQDRFGKSGEDQDHLPLKKGDWICKKCDFLNFAKNSRCLQCEEKPPKQELGPGEWQCDSKNAMCLRCEYKRPKASNSTNSSSPEAKHEGLDSTGRMSNDKADEPNGGVNAMPERWNQHRSTRSWRFVEDEAEDKDTLDVGQNNVLEFLDFPIKGGAGELSGNEQKILQWKLEMVESKKNARHHQNKELHPTVDRRSRFLEDETDDGNEMDEWFGKADDGENRWSRK
ncbi:Zinc finger protein VAR3, chloroplastic-like protein, partial [Drosera capensis]